MCIYIYIDMYTWHFTWPLLIAMCELFITWQISPKLGSKPPSVTGVTGAGWQRAGSGLAAGSSARQDTSHLPKEKSRGGGGLQSAIDMNIYIYIIYI